ncbi:MAG: DEAD/DEAH box helicase family protein [Chthonomonadales bacterium]|nr:DEAD/DEAH box helicase family protein [Chthonomonadales bacterium]
MNEADTRRELVAPKLRAAGWHRAPHSYHEEVTFTDGRIIVTGGVVRRAAGKRADYILRYSRDIPLAVVEAKPDTATPAAGLQQAMDYARILDLPFAYSTNGTAIVEHDFLTGAERELETYPAPAELWARKTGEAKLSPDAVRQLDTPGYVQPNHRLRYYQETAVNRALEAIVGGKRKALLTMATGTGKTDVAFQICWRLWGARWTADGSPRRPKILYLADRNILVNDPKDKQFAPFGDARQRIENQTANKARDIYFSTYQTLAEDASRAGLYRQFPPSFFDLIIVDECHRGSAREDGAWREILDYFATAVKLGMTATPVRTEDLDTYRYFGNPVYTYSLRQGIDDGFLAPYRVHRVITDYDAAGWRPSVGERDRYGKEIPDGEYGTADFERIVALRARTSAISKHMAAFMRANDRFAKTIAFCVGQEHASEMRHALADANQDLVAQHPDYVCRVTAEEGDIGKGHLGRFQDVESETPVILTTSQLLTTGVDAPTCRVIALARVVNSMVEFKQMIGRGTRVRDDYGKLFFTILDYTGSATRLFADPDFDGEPVAIVDEAIGEDGDPTQEPLVTEPEPFPDTGPSPDDDGGPIVVEPPTIAEPRRKYYVDGGICEIATHLVYELDSEGKQLRVLQYTEYAAEKVRRLFVNGAHFRKSWADRTERRKILAMFEERGISFTTLAEQLRQPDADPVDLLCHLAFDAPIRTRRERASRVRLEERAFFARHSPQARELLDALLDKYIEAGTTQFAVPEVLKVPPLLAYGNTGEIARMFGGVDNLRGAVLELQSLLYAQ